MAGQVSASTTRPGTSLLVAIQTLASPSQRASMLMSLLIIESSDSSNSGSIPQQLIDARLCARLLVDALDDHGAIEARARGAVLAGFARHRARHHYRIGRHFALIDRAGLAIDDSRRGAEIDAHREYRALAHDHAFGDFRARADETVVLDDHRAGLQRLEHAADAGAARDVAVLADLRAGADGRPGVDHGAAVDIGAEIDEGGHQHHARRHIGGLTHDAAWHGGEAGLAEEGIAPGLGDRGDFVPTIG